jgi:hypothetical protein
VSRGRRYLDQLRAGWLDLTVFKHGKAIAARNTACVAYAELSSSVFYTEPRGLARPTQDRWIDLWHLLPLFGQADTWFDMIMQSLRKI